MLAKLTSKNQLTLPKSVTDSLGPVQYFEVQVQAGQVVLTPVRIQRGDAVRAKLAELDLGDEVFAQALTWAADGPSVVATKAQAGAGKARSVHKPSTADGKRAPAVKGLERPKASSKSVNSPAGARGGDRGKANAAARAAPATAAVKASKAIAGSTVKAVAKSASKDVKTSTRSTSTPSASSAKPAAPRSAASKARRSAA